METQCLNDLLISDSPYQLLKQLQNTNGQVLKADKPRLIKSKTKGKAEHF